MASLVRSLLALAVVALLQVACAQFSPCKTFQFGRRSDLSYGLPRIHLTKPDNKVHIIDHRPSIGTILIGQEITICSSVGSADLVPDHKHKHHPLDYVRVVNYAKGPLTMEMDVTRFLEIPPNHG
ncbi:uncharacterized protein [Choristoneura fumiferana]|uniref:uncharacterized protein n=1 Tax=Choristoneura fumiferana TaxID=7141 RepID=UPI003D154F11